MHKYETVIRLHHTDAAGIVYFANLFVLAHECYETFLEKWTPIGQMIEQGQLVIPIAHAEADYFEPLRLSENIRIDMALTSIGKSSFELQHLFYNTSSKLSATVKMIHVIRDRSTGKPIDVPEDLAAMLKELQDDDNL
ncbi:MAG: acyl-CoA thioesterase [Anaerohalosphaera sp.]|nr:acyl-CoA thioesterase [Anaerohalosphaera sp.]